MTEFENTLKNSEFIGIVEDNKDPDKKQRVRIRIPYLHGDVSAIPTDAIPWAQPIRDNNGLSFSVPDLNKIVMVTFPTGNQYFPVYRNAVHLNVNLQKKIEQYSDTDYTSFVALIYNHNTQVYMNNAEGLKLYHKFNGINITEDSIIHELKDNGATMFLGDKTGNQELVLGTNFFKWLDSFTNVMMNAYLTSSPGSPAVATPQLLDVLAQYRGLRSTFVSKHIYATDNNQIRSKDFDVEGQIGDNIEVSISNSKTLNVENSELNTNETNDKFLKTQKEEINYKPKDYTTDPTLEERVEFVRPIVQEIPIEQIPEDGEVQDSWDEPEYVDEYEEYDDYYDFYNDDEADLFESIDEEYGDSGSSSNMSSNDIEIANTVVSNPATGNKKKDVELMVKFLKSRSYTVYETPYVLNIVGIRNQLKDKGAVTNKFDDYIWVFFKNDKGQWELYIYNVTTTPGFIPKTTKIPSGVAMMVYGQYIDTYTIGYHRGRDGKKQEKRKDGTLRTPKAHPCLRNALTNFVRNPGGGNKYITRDEIKKKWSTVVKNVAIGLNIHRSGDSGVTTNVYNYSEGCQVFAAYNQHVEFMSLCNQQKTKANKSKFTYTLIAQADFEEFKKYQK